MNAQYISEHFRNSRILRDPPKLNPRKQFPEDPYQILADPVTHDDTRGDSGTCGQYLLLSCFPATGRRSDLPRFPRYTDVLFFPDF